MVLAVADALGLENVRADHGRAEEFKGSYDFIVSRAVTQMQRFVPWIKGKISQKNLDSERINGLLYLKGGDLAEELGTMKARISSLSNFFTSEFFETKKVVYLPKSEINQFRG